MFPVDVRVVAAVVAVTAVGGLLLVSGGGGAPQPTNATVINCTGEGCHMSNISERPVGCTEWYADMPRDMLECNWTSDGIDAVTMVTDPGNYITASMTDTDVTEERVTHALRSSWDLEFLPDGRLIVTEDPNGEEFGNVVLYDDRRTVLGNISTVNGGVAGLMGLAVDPRFEENGYVYVSFTDSYDDPEEGGDNRAEYYTQGKVVRYRLQDGRLTDRTVLIDDIKGYIHSAGSRLEFGPDGLLYVTTGFGGFPRRALDPADLRGSVLRVDHDGEAPRDNPHTGRDSSDGRSDLVYARGLKNPQGLAWDPETGDLYVTDHGKNRYDEVNHVLPGRNHGFGVRRCGEPYQFTKSAVDQRHLLQDITGPAWCTEDWTLAPSGATFVDDPDHPWHGDLFVAGLRGAHLHRYVVDDGTVVDDEIFWYNERMGADDYWGRVRDVEFRDGTLWVLTDAGGLVTLSPAS